MAHFPLFAARGAVCEDEKGKNKEKGKREENREHGREEKRQGLAKSMSSIREI